MSTIMDVRNPWRNLLRTPASWRRVIFHVETGARMSGRRVALHEYPKLNTPYSEDMGRHARRWNFSGYLIYRPSNPIYEYTRQRIALMNALEADGPGPLIHPVLTQGQEILCVCERYTMVENRQRGGFTEFEMMFVEAGSPGNFTATTNSASAVQSSAANLGNSQASNLNAEAARAAQYTSGPLSETSGPF